MPRRPRVFIAGLIQHVIHRGHDRGVVFRQPSDYSRFLTLLHREARQCRVDVHVYALMTNHIHLMVTPSSADGLPRMMQGLGRSYVPFFNAKYQRTGALWEGRYRSLVLETEQYWLTCMRYVELNPVRAGLVTHADEYRWSSYRVHAHGAGDPLIVPHPLYLRLGTTPGDRQQAWRAVCRREVPEYELAAIRHGVHTGASLEGSDL